MEGTGALAAISKGRYQSGIFDTDGDEGVAVVSMWGEVEREGESSFETFAKQRY